MRKLIACLIGMALMLTAVFPANAADSTAGAIPAVQEARKGVLRISTRYVDGEKGDLGGYVGTGFLIGATSGAEYMITNEHVVRFSDEDLNSIGEMVERKVSNDDPEIKIQVHVKADVTIDATVEHFSEQFDFAILKLAQPIYDRTPLTLYDSEENLQATQTVYALGFPELASAGIQDVRYFDTEDVNVTTGIVSKFSVFNNIDYILHEAKISGGNSGGPLVDQNGYVVGVNQIVYNDAKGMSAPDLAFAENYYLSFRITEVTSVLKALGIQYTSVEGGLSGPAQEETEESEEPEPEPEPPVPAAADKSALESAITAAGTIVPEDYTRESSESFESALEKAQEVSADTLATQDDVNAAVSALTEAQQNLVKKGPPMALFVCIGLGAAVLLVVVVVLAVSAAKKKQRREQQAAPARQPAAPTGPIAPTPVHPQPDSPPVHPPYLSGNMGNDGAGTTTLLNAGAGETSVLGGIQISAALIRKKNNETIQIDRQLFRIGKERAKVDYCVPDNNSISRIHAHIINKGGTFYIVDQNSTNFTFVNGNKISPNQETALNNGDKIKLSDEEFEFRI